MTENEQSRRTRGSRPGAMTMAMEAVQTRPSGPKVLRIGLIQGGKIVEERIIRKRETVTVGASEKNHFVIQAQGLSSRFELFQLVGNDYILNFTDQMRGRVGLAAGVKELDELRKSGARKAQGYYQVKLTESSRGKVVIGDTTLLFQFVTPPPVQPRPQLPAAAKGGGSRKLSKSSRPASFTCWRAFWTSSLRHDSAMARARASDRTRATPLRRKRPWSSSFRRWTDGRSP